MTSLLGVPGDPPRPQRGTATVTYTEDVHGSPVLVDVDGGPDEVLPAAIRYDPMANPPAVRDAAREELLAVLDGEGWLPLGPVLWGGEEFRVRVQR